MLGKHKIKVITKLMKIIHTTRIKYNKSYKQNNVTNTKSYEKQKYCQLQQYYHYINQQPTNEIQTG